MRRLFLYLFAARVFADPGRDVCGPCHSDIVKSYALTGMARASTADSLGSGSIGKSYIAFIDGFLIQTPRSFFAKTNSFGLSPGFRDAKTYRPVEEPCLQCHATGVRIVKGTQNQYPNPPFAEPGIACSRCHGTSQQPYGPAHAVNPAKLTPERRDNVCEQCHLTGAAKVTRADKNPYDYRPGDRLGDFVSIFVESSKNNATDHVEQLSESACKQAAGDKLWCVTCHDPHGGLKPNACQTCHTPDKCGRGPACATCHMPKTESTDAHVAFTNHRIIATPRAKPQPKPFRLFWPGPAPARELALARPTIAALEKIEPKDAAVLTQLGQLYDRANRGPEAAALYRRALRLNPSEPTAAANLAIYEFQNGQVAAAMARWQDVFARYPGLPGPGINLALAQSQRDDAASARATLLRLLRFHPGNTQARELLSRLPP